MSFFGKLKSLHSGPPPPPTRIDNNASCGWPEDEFDEEEGDTYEVPPCERPVIKVPPRPLEENVYLERTPDPVPKRQTAPPPRPAKMAPMGKASKQHPQKYQQEFYMDPNTKKPPEVDRKEKPGKKSAPKKAAPPPGRLAPPLAPPPAPAPASNFEEDVYLDPNEGQEDSDDLYLDPPTAACPPPPRGPMRALLAKASPAITPMPLVKPPVPRAKSSSHLVESKPAPTMDMRRSTFPGKLPPPTLREKAHPPASLRDKAHPPASLREPKPSPPPPPAADSPSAASFSGVKMATPPGKEDMEWFAGSCDRKTAEDILMRINKDGAFLVRYSQTQSPAQPYTLAVLYRNKVYNIPVRFLEETHNYALGKEGRKNEEFVGSLQDLISYHMRNQLLLIDSKSHAKHTTYLTHPSCR